MVIGEPRSLFLACFTGSFHLSLELHGYCENAWAGTACSDHQCLEVLSILSLCVGRGRPELVRGRLPDPDGAQSNYESCGISTWFCSCLAPKKHTDAILIMKLLAIGLGFLLASSVLIINQFLSI